MVNGIGSGPHGRISRLLEGSLVNSGYCCWLTLHLTSVSLGGLLTQSLEETITQGRWQSGLHKKMVGYATAALLANLALLQYTRKTMGDASAHFRKCRKIVLRFILATVLLCIACYLETHRYGDGEGVCTWISVFALLFQGLSVDAISLLR